MSKKLFVLVLILYVPLFAAAQSKHLEQLFPLNQQQKQQAKPWVFWYWMQGAVSKAGITADLEAMKEVGIGGAYLMPIKGPTNPPAFQPSVNQLTPEWWDMVKFSMQEAKRLHLTMGMHVSDGFALAGGPWITPALSMQKVVFSKTSIEGGKNISVVLPQPISKENYYQDIAVLAYPSPVHWQASTRTIIPTITTSKAGVDAQALVKEGNKTNFKTDDSTWIQYSFEKPFTCRTIEIKTGGNNYQAHRLWVQASDDGIHFRNITRLIPPRHGWQDTDADVTHTIPATTARYFRLVYDKKGSEPGAEDLDAAKWKQSLKLLNVHLSSEPHIQHYESKTGEIWRISPQSDSLQLPDNLCIPVEKIIDVSAFVDKTGRLQWNAPKGNWVIVRMGHTSTGHTNATGGGAKGLECDKFNPEAVKLQFEHWFGEAQRQLGETLSNEVLKVFHVDSWECGSQNWTPLFETWFKTKRGYDLRPYLLLLTGVPVENRRTTEQVLYDMRQTIAELVVEQFYGTLASITKAKGLQFSAESIAPTMVSDGLAHYRLVDLPMGEFWLNSPTHDKPNDMLDAIAAAHIYGKNVVQAEGFTTVRMMWNEHPAMLKPLQDRNYALGINKLVYHVFTHNPWLDRQPGMTLDGVGLYFQRDQTWWKPAKAWVQYAERCQWLLQQGHPVADIAVFTGDDIPRRALLPEKLLGTLDGLLGKAKVAAEQKRLANEGLPMRQMPVGVTNAANITDPAQWVNALHGYQYDSFTADALWSLAKNKGKQVQFASTNAYGLVVVSGASASNPNASAIHPTTVRTLWKLVNNGATVLLAAKPRHSFTHITDKKFKYYLAQLWDGKYEKRQTDSAVIFVKKLGKGMVIKAPYLASSLSTLGIEPDLMARDTAKQEAANIAWTHRKTATKDLYFIANQEAYSRKLQVSLRINAPNVQLYDAVTDELMPVNAIVKKGRTELELTLPAFASVFVIASKTLSKKSAMGVWQTEQELQQPWQVSFDTTRRGPVKVQTFAMGQDWRLHSDTLIKYYAGTATYQMTLSFEKTVQKNKRYFLYTGEVANMAHVKLNGKDCGITWTAPYRVDITEALQQGKNNLVIEVSNTWANRLIGDHRLPEAQRFSFTTAPYRLEGRNLEPSGLLGKTLLIQSYTKP